MSDYLNKIVANISNWENKKSDFNYLIAEMFEQHLGFDFNLSQVQFPSSEDTVHCYFGINSFGKLIAYLVASSNDTENQRDWSSVVYEVECSIKTFPMLNNNEDAVISPSEAYQITQNWNGEYPTWTLNQSLNDQIFYAFQIPAADIIIDTNYTAFFGLMNELTFHTEYYGTLVLYSQDQMEFVSPKQNTNSEGFYNTVMPVPPYEPIVSNTYYLQQLATRTLESKLE
ncbi:MAG: hypothetical protein ACJA1C_003380 [Crocinitomicaceae bacterium]|jgi:hypothetical protein